MLPYIIPWLCLAPFYTDWWSFIQRRWDPGLCQYLLYLYWGHMFNRYGYGTFAFLLTRIPVSFSRTLWISKNIWDSHKYVQLQIWKNAKRKEYEEIQVICVQLHKCLFNSAPIYYTLKLTVHIAAEHISEGKLIFCPIMQFSRKTVKKILIMQQQRRYCTKQLPQLYYSIQHTTFVGIFPFM